MSDPRQAEIVWRNGKEYVSLSEAARLSGYTPDYVGQLARGGKLTSELVGNIRLIEVGSLRAYVDSSSSLRKQGHAGRHPVSKSGWPDRSVSAPDVSGEGFQSTPVSQNTQLHMTPATGRRLEIVAIGIAFILSAASALALYGPTDRTALVASFSDALEVRVGEGAEILAFFAEEFSTNIEIIGTRIRDEHHALANFYGTGIFVAAEFSDVFISRGADSILAYTRTVGNDIALLASAYGSLLHASGSAIHDQLNTLQSLDVAVVLSDTASENSSSSCCARVPSLSERGFIERNLTTLASAALSVHERTRMSAERAASVFTYSGDYSFDERRVGRPFKTIAGYVRNFFERGESDDAQETIVESSYAVAALSWDPFTKLFDAIENRSTFSVNRTAFLGRERSLRTFTFRAYVPDAVRAGSFISTSIAESIDDYVDVGFGIARVVRSSVSSANHSHQGSPRPVSSLALSATPFIDIAKNLTAKATFNVWTQHDTNTLPATGDTPHTEYGEFRPPRLRVANAWESAWEGISLKIFDTVCRVIDCTQSSVVESVEEAPPTTHEKSPIVERPRTIIERTIERSPQIFAGVSVADLNRAINDLRNELMPGIEEGKRTPISYTVLPPNTGGSSGSSGVSTFLALTDTQSAFTANRIPHTNSGGTALTDTAGFVFDGTNLGVGTTSPTSQLSLSDLLYVGGTGTSTIAGGLDLSVLSVTSSSATSTFANGIALSGGCFELPDGTCAGAGGDTFAWTTTETYGETVNATSTPLWLQDTLYASSTVFIDGESTFGGNVGIGTTSPWAKLSVEQGSSDTNLFVIGDEGTSSPSFIVDGSGNVGIGATSPSSRLTINDGTFLLTPGDATSSSTPEFVGGIKDGINLNNPNGLDIVGNYAYVANANDDSLRIIDISDPESPAIVGGVRDIVNLDGAFGVDVSGNYAYVVSENDDSLRIIDVSNPEIPSVVGGIKDATLLNFARKVQVVGKYAYVMSVSNNSIRIIDVSDPTAPYFVGGVKDDTLLTSLRSMYVLGKYVYVVGVGNYIRIIDVSDPTSPIIIGSLTDGTNLNGARDVYVVGRYAYIANSSDDSLRIVDISDPASPTIVGGVKSTTDLDGAISVFVAGRYAYVGSQTDTSVRIIDVSSSTNPYLIGGIQHSSNLNTPQRVVVAGKYLYVVSDTDDSLRIIDIGGLDVPAARIGSLAAGAGFFSDNLTVSGHGIFGGGLNVGIQGLLSNGFGSFTHHATTSPTGLHALTGTLVDSNTSSVVDVLNITHMASSSAANNIGAGLLFSNEDEDGNATSTSRIASIFTNISTSSPASVLAFYNKNTNGELTEFMRLDENGNLGLGTTSPYTKLAVEGDVSASHFIATSTTATSTFANGIALSGGCFEMPDGSCLEAGGSPGGSDTQIQYNNGGSFGGVSTFLYDDAGGSFTLGTSTAETELSTLTIAATSSDTTNILDLEDTDGTSIFTVGYDGTFTYGTAATSTIASNAFYAFTLATSTSVSPIFQIDTTSGGPSATTSITGGFSVNSGAILYDAGSNITTIENLNLGNLSFETDAGAVQWVNLPVSSSAAASTTESYTAFIDDLEVLTVYGQADGSGGVKNLRVIIGTTTDAVMGNPNIPYHAFIVAEGIICVDDSAGADCDNSARTLGGVYAEAGSLAGLDLAETYPTKETNLGPGDVVMLDPENPLFVKKSDVSSSIPYILGVVSTKPGLTLGGFKAPILLEGERQVPIALAGRVPVKISDENGAVAVGDRLTYSTSSPGYAVKASVQDVSFGIALEAYTGAESGKYAEDVFAEAASTTPAITESEGDVLGTSTDPVLKTEPVADTILVFVRNDNPTDHSLALLSFGGVTSSDTATSSEEHIPPFYKNLLAFLESFGVKIAKAFTYIAHLVTDSLTVGSRSAPAGVTLFDKATGEPYCLEIVNGKPTATEGECGQSGTSDQQPTAENSSEQNSNDQNDEQNAHSDQNGGGGEGEVAGTSTSNESDGTSDGLGQADSTSDLTDPPSSETAEGQAGTMNDTDITDTASDTETEEDLGEGVSVETPAEEVAADEEPPVEDEPAIEEPPTEEEAPAEEPTPELTPEPAPAEETEPTE